MKKLHIGCGTVYLKGWVNVDAPSRYTYLASERPDLVDKYITTEDNYYGRHEAMTIDRLRAGPQVTETVCDLYGIFQMLPCRPEACDEILARQVFEHFDIEHARQALLESNRVLSDGGVLRLDVPDNDKTLHCLKETQDDFYIRHFVGPRSKGDYGYHCVSYHREGLINLVTEYDFVYLLEEPNIHNYPAFCLRFRKLARSV